MELGSASASAEAGAETTSEAAEAKAALRTKSRRVGMEESMRGAGFLQQDGLVNKGIARRGLPPYIDRVFADVT